jgi:hypothetical protein
VEVDRKQPRGLRAATTKGVFGRIEEQEGVNEEVWIKEETRI